MVPLSSFFFFFSVLPMKFKKDTKAARCCKKLVAIAPVDPEKKKKKRQHPRSRRKPPSARRATHLKNLNTPPQNKNKNYGHQHKVTADSYRGRQETCTQASLMLGQNRGPRLKFGLLQNHQPSDRLRPARRSCRAWISQKSNGWVAANSTWLTPFRSPRRRDGFLPKRWRGRWIRMSEELSSLPGRGTQTDGGNRILVWTRNFKPSALTSKPWGRQGFFNFLTVSTLFRATALSVTGPDGERGSFSIGAGHSIWPSTGYIGVGTSHPSRYPRLPRVWFAAYCGVDLQDGDQSIGQTTPAAHNRLLPRHG